MLRVFIITLVFLIGKVAFTQVNTEFKSIDKHALKTPNTVEKDLQKLTDYLSKKASNDFEKVRSFYIWLVNNIDYDNAAIKPGAKRINHSNQDVLNRKKAICQGYSNIFKEMCRLSKIPCEVVPGYPKTPRNASPDLSTANHTWNVVLLGGKWYLLDATWGAGNSRTYLEEYFLTKPEIFIIDHLPSDPMWQLLDCPINTADFKKGAESLSKQIENQVPCFNFHDSIDQFMSLNLPERKLKNANNAYRFNPVEENKKYLGSMYTDFANYLSDQSYELELQDSVKAVLKLQLEIIKTYEKASEYIDLYSHQKENLAYTHFNYAVALSRGLPDLESKKDKSAIVACYNEMLHHFEVGRTILSEVPPNVLSENGLVQFDEYIDYVQSKLKNYQ